MYVYTGQKQVWYSSKDYDENWYSDNLKTYF